MQPKPFFATYLGVDWEIRFDGDRATIHCALDLDDLHGENSMVSANIPANMIVNKDGVWRLTELMQIFACLRDPLSCIVASDIPF